MDCRVKPGNDEPEIYDEQEIPDEPEIYPAFSGPS
jgi:hypothetical protein